MVWCARCRREFSKETSLSRHIGQTPSCSAYYLRRAHQSRTTFPSAIPHPTLFDSAPYDFDPQEFDPQDDSFALPPSPEHAIPLKKGVHILEVEDEEATTTFRQHFPGKVGTTLGWQETSFERMRAERTAAGTGPYAPFQDEEEWELAEWMFSALNQKDTQSFLKLKKTRKSYRLGFQSNYTFLRTVDKLPIGPAWKCSQLTLTGDEVIQGGKLATEELELWWRDPVEVVKELIGNPAFRDNISYAPERAFADGAGKNRIYDEMWTGDWWWSMQEELEDGAVVVPLIVASDKTKLTQFSGDKVAWPVYLTIGNISKELRRQPSSYATAILAYLPVSKLECFSKATRSEAGHRLFHKCLAIIFQCLHKAGRHGIIATCADGFLRKLFLILAAYLADYPEQCLVACCRQNACPNCLVAPKDRGDTRPRDPRKPTDSIRWLRLWQQGRPPPECNTHNLSPVFEPFWQNLPHTDIFQCITPDILHQLHKGLFKDHLFQWCVDFIKSHLGLDKNVIDKRFMSIPDQSGVRRFSAGVTSISQWTGKEFKQMQKVFLPALAGVVDDAMLPFIRSLLDFIYYAQYHTHTDQSLGAMQRALDAIHSSKDVIIKLELRDDFNFPKFHSLLHYITAIRKLGCLDGLNTESPERLHIDYAKEPFAAASHRDYTMQMTTRLRRQQAFHHFNNFLIWVTGIDRLGSLETDAGNLEGDDDCDANPDNLLSITDLIRVTKVQRAYSIPQNPSYRNLSVQILEEQFGASNFIHKLNRFLSCHVPNSQPAKQFNQFCVYNAIRILSPSSSHASPDNRITRLQAAPDQVHDSNIRRIGGKEHFDCALVIKNNSVDSRKYTAADVGVAQLRVIFDLPPDLGPFPHPLVYVHWFRPFNSRQIDSKTTLYPLSKATENRKPRGEIISASRLLHGCLLVPQFGPEPAFYHKSELAIREYHQFFFARHYDLCIFDRFAAAHEQCESTSL